MSFDLSLLIDLLDSVRARLDEHAKVADYPLIGPESAREAQALLAQAYREIVANDLQGTPIAARAQRLARRLFIDYLGTDPETVTDPDFGLGVEAEFAVAVERATAAAGLGIFAQVFEIIRNRGEMNPADLNRAIGDVDLAELYEAHLGPAVDAIQAALAQGSSADPVLRSYACLNCAHDFTSRQAEPNVKCPNCGSTWLQVEPAAVESPAHAELLSVRFTTGDLDWMAERAGVSAAVAADRARASAWAIRDTLVSSGNELLLEAVQGTL